MQVLEATAENIRVAAKILANGGLVVHPTDTVYGLGCDPFNIDAVKRVFRVKGERKKPLPILAASLEDVEKIAKMPDKARRITEKFWPGPLTLILLKSGKLPSIVTCGTNSVGLRIPKHGIALKFIRLSGGLVVGTSANRSGLKPPRTASEAAEQLGDDVDVILNGGPALIGVSSTVIDLTSGKVKMLREGPISFDEIREALRQQ